MNQAWWGERANGSRLHRHVVVASIVVVAVIAIGVVATRGHGNGGYRVVMRPAAPLSASACKTEERKLRMTIADDPLHASERAAVVSGYGRERERREWVPGVSRDRLRSRRPAAV